MPPASDDGERPQRKWVFSVGTLKQRLFVAAQVLCAVVALTAWALSSPVGSSPDDDFHLASTWCAPTAWAGGCVRGADGMVTVPAMTGLAPCFAFKPEVSGACQASLVNHAPVRWPNGRANLTGFYPPVFYATMGTMASSDVVRSAYLMRVFNCLLLVGLVGFALAIAPKRIRQAGLLAALIGFGPLGWFIVASNNPSSWAVTGVTAFWISFASIVFSVDLKRRVMSGIVAITSLVVAAGARVDAACYVAVIAVAMAIGVLLWRGATRTIRCIVGVGALAACAVAAAVYSTSTQGTVVAGGFQGGDQSAPAASMIHNLVELPKMLFGGFGYWGIGWLDTALPAAVPILLTFAFGGVILVGFARIPSWALVTWLVVAVAFVAIPLRIYQQNGISVGAQIQPRYMLPMIPALLGLALLRNRPQLTTRLSRTQVGSLVILLTAVFVKSLHVNIRRYVTGTDATYQSLSRAAEWWSQPYVSPNELFIIGSLAFAGLMITSWSCLRGR